MGIDSIISWVTALAAIAVVVLVAVKTPKKYWLNKPSIQSKSQHGWASVYTTKEKLRLLAVYILWLLPLYLTLQYVIYSVNNYNFYCNQTMGVSHLIWFLVGMFSLLILLVMGVSSYLWLYWQKVHRCQQFPLPGQKVWKPQKFIKGGSAIRRAKLFKWVLLTLGIGFLIILLVLAILLAGLISPENIIAKCADFQ